MHLLHRAVDVGASLRRRRSDLGISRSLLFASDNCFAPRKVRLGNRWACTSWGGLR
jgi:hypothetical protein